MSARCPQDGGFVGDAGCTHPNHAHSALVERIAASADAPRMVSTSEAEAALREGFYVSNPDGARVGFGRRLLDHIERGGRCDAARRKGLRRSAEGRPPHRRVLYQNGARAARGRRRPFE